MTTSCGIPIRFRIGAVPDGKLAAHPDSLRLHTEHARLKLLRGFDHLLCLDGLQGVEYLPHQIETVRKVLRRFHGRVLLADEVGLGKTIEACLLLREYLLRGLVRRVLILVPAPLVLQWDAELRGKFDLDFAIASTGKRSDGPEFWTGADRVLASLSFAKSAKRAELVAKEHWDLVIVDEAHHCKNRATRNWQLVNSLHRKYTFLLSATPVQNNLVELHNLLSLLDDSYSRDEDDFRRKYIRTGSPNDPRNRAVLRSLLSDVMIRNTRSLARVNLPPRLAYTVVAQPDELEARLSTHLTAYLRAHYPTHTQQTFNELAQACSQDTKCEPSRVLHDLPSDSAAASQVTELKRMESGTASVDRKYLRRMQLFALLAAQGSHPAALALTLDRISQFDAEARSLIEISRKINQSAKDKKLLEVIRENPGHRILVFVNFRRTLSRLQQLLSAEGISFSTFFGEQSRTQNDDAVEAFRHRVSVMLCTDSGGEGRNFQFADTLVNYDLPWDPMQIEQRVGRVHRVGQLNEVHVFNLCTAGSIEHRLLELLTDRIRMFDLIVGEVGSVLGNLNEGEEFESIVLNLWLNARNDAEVEAGFDRLGDLLLNAQQQYLQAKGLGHALFGDDYE